MQLTKRTQFYSWEYYSLNGENHHQTDKYFCVAVDTEVVNEQGITEQGIATIDIYIKNDCRNEIHFSFFDQDDILKNNYTQHSLCYMFAQLGSDTPMMKILNRSGKRFVSRDGNLIHTIMNKLKYSDVDPVVRFEFKHGDKTTHVECLIPISNIRDLE